MSVKIILACLLLSASIYGQELNCKVVINADQVQSADRSVFKDMERSFANFLNTRKWTNDSYKNHERINCTIFLNISRMPSIGNFQASAQITSGRPIFNSNYESVMLNFADRDWEFDYIESQPLEYNDNSYLSNLTSMLAFYAYIIIGMDYDSFSEMGGTPHFQKALMVVNNAQTSGRSGWTSLSSIRNRNSLIESINNPQLVELRKNNYRYHRLALDVFDKKPEESRSVVINILREVKKAWTINPNSILIVSFFDSKSSELVNIFSKASLGVKREAYDILTAIDSKRTIYQEILNNK